MTKSSRQKFKYLENKKRFQGELKSIFKSVSFAETCVKPEGAPLSLEVAWYPVTINETKKAGVVKKLGSLGNFAPWGILGLGSIRTFWGEKQDKKNC